MAGTRVAETETAATVPHVQDDAPCPRLVQVGQHLALRVKPRRRSAEDVGAYVARAQFFAQELVVGPLLFEVAKVDHHPCRGLLGSRERAIDRNPFGADVVRRFDADDHVLVFSRHARRLVGIHVVRILLVVDRGHSGAGDVDQREEAASGSGRLPDSENPQNCASPRSRYPPASSLRCEN